MTHILYILQTTLRAFSVIRGPQGGTGEIYLLETTTCPCYCYLSVLVLPIPSLISHVALSFVKDKDVVQIGCGFVIRRREDHPTLTP